MAEMVLPGARGVRDRELAGLRLRIRLAQRGHGRSQGPLGSVRCLIPLQAPILVQFWGRNQDAYKRLEIPELRHRERIQEIPHSLPLFPL